MDISWFHGLRNEKSQNFWIPGRGAEISRSQMTERKSWKFQDRGRSKNGHLVVSRGLKRKIPKFLDSGLRSGNFGVPGDRAEVSHSKQRDNRGQRMDFSWTYGLKNENSQHFWVPGSGAEIWGSKVTEWKSCKFQAEGNRCQRMDISSYLLEI